MAIVDAATRVGVARIGDPFFFAEQFGESLEMFVAPRIDAHIAVFGFEHAHWHADRFGGATLQILFHHRAFLQGERAFKQAGFDVCTAAFHGLAIECGGHRLKGIEAGREVDCQHFDALRRAVNVAVDRHQPGERLHYRVGGGLIGERAGGAEAGDGKVDDVRVGFLYAGVIEFELVDLADAVVLDQNIAPGGELLYDGDPFGGLQINRQRTLGTIDDDRMRGLVAGVFAEQAAPAARTWWLDLDHIGAVAREMHAAIGAGNALREVENFEAFEGEVVVGGGHRCSIGGLCGRNGGSALCRMWYSCGGLRRCAPNPPYVCWRLCAVGQVIAEDLFPPLRSGGGPGWGRAGALQCDVTI